VPQTARAIATCNIPTISGVGHETDFTICDFVADVRAATPTAAAELACADSSQIKQILMNLAQQLNRQVTLRLNQEAQKLDYLSRRLISPSQKLTVQMDHTKALSQRINFAMQQQLKQHQQHYVQLKSSLEQLSPTAVLSRGYAIVAKDKQAITNSEQLRKGDQLQVQFHIGEIEAEVVKKR